MTTRARVATIIATALGMAALFWRWRDWKAALVAVAVFVGALYLVSEKRS